MFGFGENELCDSCLIMWLVILIVNSVCIVEILIVVYYVMVVINLIMGENLILVNFYIIEIVLNLLV